MRDERPSGVFPFPAGILLYNRPAYAEQTLAALAAQDLPLDRSRLVIVRDGYAGSREERFGEPDHTAEVDALVARYFPDVTYIRFDRNRGIALAYEELASASFAHDTQWAAFFEEDFVVDPDYTTVLVQLVEAARDVSQIGTLSATGDVAVKRTRGMDTLYPDRHLWAYVMNRRVWAESRDIIEAYLGLLGSQPYWDRNNDALVGQMADLGFIVPGASQDYIKLGFMRANGYLALNTAQAHGFYIGQVGLHHNEELFAAWGYDAARQPRAEVPVIPALTPQLLSELEHISRVMWARETFGYRQTVGERVRGLDRRLAELRGQLRATQEALSASASAHRDDPDTSEASRRGLGDDRGGWTWFGGSSALSIGNVSLLGLVRRQGLTPKGESCVAVIDERGDVVRVIPVLRGLPLDDHNVPTILALDKKRFVVAVTGHGETSTVTIAMGIARDGDVRLARRADIEFPDGTTYAHIVPESPDTFMLLTRCGMKNFMARRIRISTLDAISEPVTVFPWSVDRHDPFHSRRDGNRPYLITRESGDHVVFALTHDHPRAYRNGIVAGIFRGADIFDLDGTLVHSLSPDAPDWDPFAQLTQIVAPGAEDIPWIHDIAFVVNDGERIGVDVAYSVTPMSERDFRFWTRGRHPSLRYVVVRRLDDGTLDTVFEADAGPSLYEGEEHYAGGIALNPHNSEHIVYSVGVTHDDPARAGHPHPVWNLMAREITGGVEQRRLLESGTPTDSFVRPVFSRSAPNAAFHALFAMRGRYSTYSDFSTRIRSTIFRTGESCVEAEGEHLDLMYPVRAVGSMPDAESKLLTRRLRRSTFFAEYGAGGSTVMAFARGVRRVVSVESDVRLAGFLRERAIDSSTDFTVIVPPVSEISEWGMPVVSSDGADIADIGRTYACALDGTTGFDTVLIDGRFRIACALRVARAVTRRTTLLFDDYGDREHYRVVERYLGRPRMVGRMAVFVIPRAVTVPDSVLTEAYRDPR